MWSASWTMMYLLGVKWENGYFLHFSVKECKQASETCWLQVGWAFQAVLLSTELLRKRGSEGGLGYGVRGAYHAVWSALQHPSCVILGKLLALSGPHFFFFTYLINMYWGPIQGQAVFRHWGHKQKGIGKKYFPIVMCRLKSNNMKKSSIVIIPEKAFHN